MNKLTFIPFKGEGKPMIKVKEGGNSNFSSVLIREEGCLLVNGLIVENKRTCAISLPNSVLEKLNIVEGGNAQVELGKVLPNKMRIQRIKTIEPQYEGHAVAINPTTEEEMDYHVSFKLVEASELDIDETINAPVETVESVEEVDPALAVGGQV